MAFKEDMYEVIRGLVHPEVVRHCKTEFDLIKKTAYLLNNVPETDKNIFNDGHVKNSFCWYGAYCFESLALNLIPKIEMVVGKKLFPSYSYSRIYYNGAIMEKHTDRDSCEYSATICIQNDISYGPWEIWFKNLKGKNVPIYLNEGDAIVYKGTDLEHWRTNYKGNEQYQAFIHYVDQNGPYTEYKYDRRLYMGMPSK